LPFFGNLWLVEITPQLANQYKVQRRLEGAAPATINREIALAKHGFNLAIKEWGWITDKRVSKVSMEKEPRREIVGSPMTRGRGSLPSLWSGCERS
jgi:hypothetical protein